MRQKSKPSPRPQTSQTPPPPWQDSWLWLKLAVYPALIFSFFWLLNSSPSAQENHYSYDTPITMPNPVDYSAEAQVAQLAVQRAAILTRSVFDNKVKGTLSKDDKSPVTKGDYGAQALIIKAIQSNFPEDEIVAEEESSQLYENQDLSQEIWTLVKNAQLRHEESERLLGGSVKSEREMQNLIDAGKSRGGPSGRIWALDPIDGTKGFLRGGQYAVCLALIVDGDVKVSAIATPNLPHSTSDPIPSDLSGISPDTRASYGVLFFATAGKGAFSRPLTDADLADPYQPISMRLVSNVAKAALCEGMEPSHSAHDEQRLVAKELGIESPSVRLDSQAKYCSIARGSGDIYLRLPVKLDYQEKIWDHAAGDLLVREAGGMVSDIYGKRLDFSAGRFLARNKGVVASPKNSHAEVVAAVKKVLKLE